MRKTHPGSPILERRNQVAYSNNIQTPFKRSNYQNRIRKLPIWNEIIFTFGLQHARLWKQYGEDMKSRKPVDWLN